MTDSIQASSINYGPVPNWPCTGFFSNGTAWVDAPDGPDPCIHGPRTAAWCEVNGIWGDLD